MSLLTFLKDRIFLLTLHMLCMIALSLFLVSVGNSLSIVLLILIFWTLILSIYLLLTYATRKKHFDTLLHTISELKQKYLIAEVMTKPHRLEDLQYYYLLKKANKSMMEEITLIKNERKEYKEYIEQWVHEVKTPIAAMKLICQNNKSDVTRKILSELERNENFVEQALFYARSEHVEKDYLIKEIYLKDCIYNALSGNRQLLLQNAISLDIEDICLTVYTDHKWIEFILNQLIINAVKYKKSHEAKVHLYAKEVDGGVCLVIRDNGIGIAPSEVSRVFEKGFTGSNGRKESHSTGIGLYLCKRLCTKLGIHIALTSIQHEYTEVSLLFPKGSFVKIQD